MLLRRSAQRLQIGGIGRMLQSFSSLQKVGMSLLVR